MDLVPLTFLILHIIIIIGVQNLFSLVYK